MAPRLPDFIIIGAQKAGTTWLAQRLAEQPGMSLARPFEVRYFDRDDNFAKGLDWYTSRFAHADADALAGEKTPDYFWTKRPKGYGPNDIPERMHQAAPQTRLLVVMRDPVRRAISALNHSIRARRLPPFVDADRMLAWSMDTSRCRLGLVHRGHYLEHLQRFLEVYPREQVQVVFFEDEIVKKPQETLNAVMAFLGRGPAQPILPRLWPENKGMNSRTGLLLHYYMPRLSRVISAIDRLLPESPPISPSPECRAKLYEHFRPLNQALFDFLGRRTDAWNGP